jgi:hypothetical protein
MNSILWMVSIHKTILDFDPHLPIGKIFTG